MAKTSKWRLLVKGINQQSTAGSPVRPQPEEAAKLQAKKGSGGRRRREEKIRNAQFTFVDHPRWPPALKPPFPSYPHSFCWPPVRRAPSGIRPAAAAADEFNRINRSAAAEQNLKASRNPNCYCGGAEAMAAVALRPQLKVLKVAFLPLS